MPFTVIPERGQVSGDSVESSNSESWDIFQHDDSGSQVANEPGNVGPEAAPFPVERLSISIGNLLHKGYVLARKAGRYYIDLADLVVELGGAEAGAVGVMAAAYFAEGLVAAIRALDHIAREAIQAADVVEDGHSRPVLCEDGLAVRVDLTEGGCFPAGGAGGEREATDPAE